MARILPFKGIRPVKDKVHLVASRSVDGYTQADLREKLKGNPFTFLHIILPDYADKKRTKPGSEERLKKTKRRYLEFLKDGIFLEDDAPCYYLYRQVKEGNVYTGIIGCSAIDDYFSKVIKVHEQTLTEREEKLKHYLEVCEFNAEPVLFCYPDDETIEKITEEQSALDPEYDFTTTDKVRHSLWVIRDPRKVELIRKRFETIPSIYIADGHHRSASSALLGRSRREKNPGFSGQEPWNFYLGVFFPESKLRIYDFNRVVHDLNGLNTKDFLKKLAASFDIKTLGPEPVKPSKKHEFTLYMDGTWHLLAAKNEILKHGGPVEKLDAYLLTKYVLSPILDIHDLKTDKRIGFVSGIHGPGELKKRVDTGHFKAAFGLFPVDMSELKSIADHEEIMPPKTTWVEPKMRSGLVIFPLSHHQ